MANLSILTLVSEGVIRTAALLTQKRLKDVLDYNKDTGAFVWKIRPAKNVEIGSAAGRKEPNGHRYISVDGVDYTGQPLKRGVYEHGSLSNLRRYYTISFDGKYQQSLTISNLALPEHETRPLKGAVHMSESIVKPILILSEIRV